MRSKRKAEPLDSFESDVPITPEDVAVQAQLRDRATMNSTDYLAWCAWITRDRVEPRQDFPSEPFEL